MFQAWYFYYTWYFILTTAFLTFFYFLGKCLFYGIKTYFQIEGRWERLFLYSIFSILIATSLYALILSRGKTIHVFVIFMMVWMFLYLHKQGSIVFKSSNMVTPFWFWSELILVLLLIYSVNALFVLKSGLFPFYIPFNDHVFYNDIIKTLNIGGYENTHVEYNLFYKGNIGTFPYHYFNLWLSSLISLNGYFSTYLTHHLCTNTILICLIYVVLRILIMDITQNKITLVIYSFSFLLFGVTMNFGLPQESYAYLSEFNGVSFIIVMEKYIPMTLVFLMSRLLFLKNQVFLSMASLILMTFVYQTISPFIYVGIVLYSVWQFWRLRQQEYLSVLILLFVFIFCVLVFYIVNKGDYFMYNISIIDYTDFKFDASPKVPLIEFAYRCIMDLYNIIKINYVLIFIYVFSLFFNHQRQSITWNSPDIIIGIAIILAFLAKNLFYKMIDCEQFLGNLGPCIYVIIYLNLIQVLLSKKLHQKYRMILTTLFGVLMLSNVQHMFHRNLKTLSHSMDYSTPFLLKIDSVLSHEKNLIGVYFGSLQNYEWIPHNTIYVRHHSSFLTFYPQFLSVLDINIFNIDFGHLGHQKRIEYEFVKTNPFFQFVNKTLQNSSSIGQKQVEFIQEHNIKYGILPPGGMLEPEVEKRIENRILDTRSKITFLLFKSNQDLKLN